MACSRTRSADPKVVVFDSYSWVCVCIALIAWLAARPGNSAEGETGRATRGLLVLYTFADPSGDVIRDRSELGESLDLKIETPQAVSRQGGRLAINSSAGIVSSKPAIKLIDAIKQSGELTLEAWVQPRDNRQGGPARIVSLSADTGQRNFTLGQERDRYDVRLRTTKTDGNGIPSLSTPPNGVQAELTHIAYTRDRVGNTRFYVQGRQQAVGKSEGDLSGWNRDFRLSLANELTGDRPWLGELRLVAAYARALTDEEIGRNFAAGLKPPVDYAALLPPAADRPIDFVNDVQPIFRQRCFECHAKGNEEGGLNLGIRSRALEGGSGGAVIVRGSSAESRLVHAVSCLDGDFTMPPDGERLTAAQVGILRAWIDQGADWPASADVLDPRAEQAKQHWAFQPLHAVEAPKVANVAWPRNPIDQFILARLESAGRQPASALAHRGLIRRTAFDVIGLPPSPEDVDEFCAVAERDRDGACNALIDRLLASRHYGERWGRHWLDVARYADSDGQETDRDRPQAYQYRDFVIRALNDDMPFDQFVRWQLAGNEYEPDNPAAVAATGFLTAGPFAALPEKLMQDELLRNRYNELDDMISTIGTGLLGLTFGCARCHDHKYDAIPARDYYRMLGALVCGDRAEVTVGPSQEKILAYRDAGPQPKPSWLFRRGDYYDHEVPVTLGFLTILTRNKTPQDYWREAREKSAVKDSTVQRRALADWITDVDHGAGALVARVIVNRVWQHHFGSGLVRTVGDFGVRCEAPSHPELLEWLAHDLVQSGWKLRRLHRLILSSATYQQASSGHVPGDSADPDNRLLWKADPRRLEAEILRDAMLAVSGTLNPEMYGPGFKPPIAAEAMLARNIKDPYPNDVKDSAAVRRRSVYMFHKRVIPYPLLQAFDKPDAQQSCNRRDPTTVAPQALALLNDPFVRTAALDFADRLLKDAGSEPAKCVERGYQLAICRAPSDTERLASLEFLETQFKERTARDSKTPPDEARRRALADWCQILFSLNEFLYID